MSLMFKCSWEMFFFESEDTVVSKLIEISCLQVMKCKPTIIPRCLTCFTQTFQLCVPIMVEMSFMKNIFWCGRRSLLIFVAKKFGKGTELQFLCIQGTLQGGWVEDHRLMFTRQLQLPQLFIQAILYTHKTDYTMSLTLFTLTSVCIFSILFSIHFHFI